MRKIPAKYRQWLFQELDGLEEEGVASNDRENNKRIYKVEAQDTTVV